MNKKNVASILLIIVALIAYYYDDENMIGSKTDLSREPIYQSDSMESNIYNLSGDLIYRIKSKQVKYFDQLNKMNFELPSVMIYDNQSFGSWSIKSQKASLVSSSTLYLYRDVQLDNLTENLQLQQIKTDNAVVDLKTELVTSKDPVELKGTGLYSTGIGLLVNLKEKTAKILSNVKTYYSAE